MNAPESNLSQATSAHRLSELFEIGKPPAIQSEEELRDELDHLLSLPLEIAARLLTRKSSSKLKEHATTIHDSHAGEEPANLRELFRQGNPCREWLVFAKDFGKTIHYGEESSWPAKVGEALYYASYATALVRRGERLGTWTDAKLVEGFKKIAGWKWIGEELLALCAEAQSVLSKGKRKS